MRISGKVSIFLTEKDSPKVEKEEEEEKSVPECLNVLACIYSRAGRDSETKPVTVLL